MEKNRRIETVIDAVRIFLRSLPVGSSFAILSFGSEFRAMEINGQSILKVDAKTVKSAIAQLETFEPDMGATNAFGPIHAAFTMPWNEQPNGKRRIFFLTDGHTHDRDQTIEYVNGSDRAKVYTFGIGDDCDT